MVPDLASDLRSRGQRSENTGWSLLFTTRLVYPRKSQSISLSVLFKSCPDLLLYLHCMGVFLIERFDENLELLER